MTEREKMTAGEFYDSFEHHLIFDRIRERRLVDRYNRTACWNIPKRFRLMKRMIPHHKKMLYIEPHVRIEYGYNVMVGENFYMNYDCQLIDICPITIGDNVMFGPRVTVVSALHSLVAEERIAHEMADGKQKVLEYGKPITIGDNVWVGAGAVICGGAVIGRNSVIAAGSVVIDNYPIPEGVLAGGVPCKVIRPITEKDRLFSPQKEEATLPR